MMMFLIAAALLIPPPVPPPAPELLAAAAELRRAAPLPAEMRANALDSATYTAAHRTLQAAKITDPAWLVPVKDRFSDRIAADRARIEEQVDACIDTGFGHSYDLATLQGMKEAVSSKAGAALWSLAIKETLQHCYTEQVALQLQGYGYAGAITYAVQNGLLTRLPKYDPSAGDLSARARQLETACGAGARGKLERRGDAFGIDNTWLDRDINRDGKSAWCLLMATKVAGFPITTFR